MIRYLSCRVTNSSLYSEYISQKIEATTCLALHCRHNSLMDWSLGKTLLQNTFLRALIIGAAYAFLLVLFCVWLKFPMHGSPSYSRIAAEVANSGQFSSTYRPPFYSLIMAAVMCLSPIYWNVLLLVLQAVLGGFVVAATYFIIGRAANERSAWLAVLFIACNGPFFLEMTAQRETAVFCSLAMACLICLQQYWRNQRSRWLCIFGALAGLAHLTRPTGFLLLLPLAVSLMAINPQAFSIRPRTNKYVAAAGSILIFLVVIAPWQLRLWSTSGAATLSSSSTSGLNLWKGNNPHLFMFYPILDIDQFDAMLTEVYGDLEDPLVDDELLHSAFNYMITDPVSTIPRFLVKVSLFFSPYPLPAASGRVTIVGDSVKIEDFNPRNLLVSISYMLFTLAAYVGIGRLISRWRHLTYEQRMLFMVTAAYIGGPAILHGITFPETRFRLPFDPLIALVAAGGYCLAEKSSSLERKYAADKVRQENKPSTVRPSDQIFPAPHTQ